MNSSRSDSDMSGNQVVFRGRNEKMQKNIDEFNETAEELGEDLIETKGKEYLHFICECSDEKCSERIKVTFVAYGKIHANRDTFVVKPEHVVDKIESVIKKTSQYWVVKKYESPEQSNTKLRFTGLEHHRFGL